MLYCTVHIPNTSVIHCVYQREDGPKIGSTKIIEGKGELKGVKLLAVGDIDEVSSPHSTFSA